MKKNRKDTAQAGTVQSCGNAPAHEGRHRVLKFFYLILRISVVGVMIAQIFNRNFENVMLCVLTLILFSIPSLIEHKFKIDIPDTLEIIILMFIYAAEILGEIRSYYTEFPGWDMMLHTLNGFLCAAIGFSLIDILNRNERFKFSLSPIYLTLFAFCFSMTVGVIWEFFEFSMDHFFGMDMQKDTILTSFSTVTLDPSGGTKPIPVNDIKDLIVIHSDGTQTALGLGGYLDVGIVDTMGDLFVNFIGAAAFSVIGFLYIKNRGKGSFVKRFIPTRIHSAGASAPESSGSPTADTDADPDAGASANTGTDTDAGIDTDTDADTGADTDAIPSGGEPQSPADRRSATD